MSVVFKPLKRSAFVTQVDRSLNVVWLLSAGSLDDPVCFMEACNAVRHSLPVFPVRLTGKGIHSLVVDFTVVAKVLTKGERR